ncbi:MAG: hypothetical protein KF819_21835 [Labilithrix sp.]|nr:hypothetical protein [Labilithrix sp.]
MELTWRGIFKDVRVVVDGKELGSFPNKAALERGQTFDLGEGDELRVAYDSTFGSQGLNVSRNGKPLSGSADDPATRLKTAVGMVYFVAGLNVVLGLIAVVVESELLARIGVGWGSAVEGALYAVLGWFASRRHTWALVVAVALFAIDGIFSVTASIGAGASPPVGGLVARVFFILPMIRGIPAIKKLKNADSATRS